jgi:hypothetical protein
VFLNSDRTVPRIKERPEVGEGNLDHLLRSYNNFNAEVTIRQARMVKMTIGGVVRCVANQAAISPEWRWLGS